MKSTLAFLIIGLAIFSNNCLADFTIFTERSEFDMAVGPAFSEDLNSFVSDTSFANAPLVLEDLTLSTDSSISGSFNIIDVPPLVFDGFNVDDTPIIRGGIFQGESFTIQFDSPVNSFGADFAGLNDDLVRTELIINGQSLIPDVTVGNQVRFFGFQSNESFSTIQLLGVGASEGFGLDNLSYAQVILEPGCFGFLLGAVLFMKARRSKK